MRVNILLSVFFVSIVFYAFSGNYPTPELIGCTELNGNGCVCHDLEENPDVLVWIEGPDTLLQGQTGLYKMYLAGGPAIAGGYNVAVRFGSLSVVDSLSHWDYRVPYELTQAFPLPFLNTTDTIFWEFAFSPSDSVLIDTIYSCGLSTNWDSLPDVGDVWAFGPKYPVIILPEVPVELISFTADHDNNKINLKWTTATETNNMGFAVQRSAGKNIWTDIGFINGIGNSVQPVNYSFTDEPPLQTNYSYRLKQIDHNGSFEYSVIINIDIGSNPEVFSLYQNYPNPFNPVTKIRYNIPADNSADAVTTLRIYDLLGNEVVVLVNEYQAAGFYEVELNAAVKGLSSGVYLYRLARGNFSAVKKLILLK